MLLAADWPLIERYRMYDWLGVSVLLLLLFVIGYKRTDREWGTLAASSLLWFYLLCGQTPDSPRILIAGAIAPLLGWVATKLYEAKTRAA